MVTQTRAKESPAPSQIGGVVSTEKDGAPAISPPSTSEVSTEPAAELANCTTWKKPTAAPNHQVYPAHDIVLEATGGVASTKLTLGTNALRTTS